MLRLALKSVRHNPKRLILTAVAVALGVALVSSVFTFTNSLSKGFGDLFSTIYSTVDVVVEPDPHANLDPNSKEGLFTTANVATISALPGVKLAEGGVAYESGSLLNAAGDAPLGQGAPTLLYNWTGNSDLDRATLIDGRAPVADNEVVVDVDTFKKLGIQLGGVAKLASDTGVQDLTVVGTIRFGQNNDLQTASLLYANENTVRAIGGGLTNYSTIAVLTADGVSPATVVKEITPTLPKDTRAITAEDKAKEQSASLNNILKYVNIFALVFGLVSLFVGAYIIVNTFRIIVTQRTREFGLLRAIGAHGKQIRTMILLEAAVVGLIASTLGILLGWLLALGLAALVESFSGNILGAITLPLNGVLLGYGLGLAITIVSALLPAIHASNISPMEALREAGTAGKKSLTVRNIVGGAMAVAGIASVFIGLYVNVPKAWIWVAIGAVLVVLGVTLLAAQVLVPMAFGLRGILSRLWGVNGTLAANNIRREPRRSANTAAALMIGVMLLALVATFTASFKDTFTSQFKTTSADLFVIPTSGPIPQGALDAISGTEGVANVVRMGQTKATFDGVDYGVTYVDAAHASELYDFRTDRPLSKLDGGVFIDPTIQALGIKVGDQVTIKGLAGTETLTVTGLYTNKGDQAFLVDWPQGTALVSEPVVVQALVGFKDGANADTTTTAVKDALATNFPLVEPQSPASLTKLFNQGIDTFLGFISAMLGAALIIAILGVANTLLLSVTERTREIGLLRAVGIKRSAVWGMITLESVVMALFGTILGIILGVGLGAALVHSLSSYGIDRPVVPWALIGVYTVLSLIAGVVAAIWPAYRASRLDILKAIAADG
ncbi:ABC transporter permease [Demequina lutea]|uniref:Putative ABC transport system permease protein n=1 Tax=Demequina lutea TaxID=431489 RepID=A0A7Y9ZAM3_9MICO|nr:ABC transporter permease [Demequina lutea]NYI40600.1 putative ABC transport system permease protein [Demequina lutea]